MQWRELCSISKVKWERELYSGVYLHTSFDVIFECEYEAHDKVRLNMMFRRRILKVRSLVLTPSSHIV